MRATVLAGAAAIAAASIAVWAFWPDSIDRADAADARLVAAGEPLYRQHCASCHGGTLEGEPDWRTRKPSGRLPAPPHDATGHTWHHADAQLFALTKFGAKPPLVPPGYESDMIGFGEILTDREIWAVLAYIKSTWPPDVRGHQSRVDAASRK